MLPGGLRVVTERVPGSRTFSVGFHVEVGSRHESPKAHGASHFLEHVLFKGTNLRGPEDISAAIESVGGELNAYTGKELTCFYARVLDDSAELAVEVLTDMLTSSLIISGEVESERAVILDEIAMHNDEPTEVAQELVTQHFLRGSGLERPVIGTQQSISAITRSQIVRYWKRHYAPSRMVVSAAGRVDHDRLAAALHGLDELPDHAVRRPTRATAINPQPAVLTRRHRLEQSTVMLAYGVPGSADDRRFPRGLLSAIVGGGMASRLFVEVRERRGLTYGIDAGQVAYSDAGVWSVDWQCAPDKVVEIAALVQATLADVAERGVTADELARAQGQIRGQIVLGAESPGSRMSRFGTHEVMRDHRTLLDTINAYDAVTLADVQAEAVAVFSGPAVLCLVGPRTAKPARLERLVSRSR